MSTATTTVATEKGLRTWNIDPAHSEAQFTVRHMMISRVRGHFGKISGTIELDAHDLRQSNVEVTIDVSSIDTREPQRDAHLRSADFLDADTFPTITFKSRRVMPQAGGRLTIAGDLTIHGVTREVTLDAREEGRGKDPWGNERVGFSATTRIDRRDFGLGWNQALETGGILVGHEIDIALEVEAIGQA
jgi:polyisoprenoid-binding protein YceI